MNKIWILIILISLTFGFINGNSAAMIDALFDVPKKTIDSMITIGSILIIYNGIFNIAIKANIIKKISFIFSGFVNKVFGYPQGSYLNDTISTSIIANMLGLGAANTSIAIKVVEEIKKDCKDNVSKELAMYLLINISSFVILPLSLLALRENYNAQINILFVPILFIISLFTTLFSILLCKLVYK